jgi:hypothetical protein
MQDSLQINVSSFPKGVYFLNIVLKNGELVSNKIAKN